MCPTLPRYPVYSYRRADGARDINAVGSGRPTNRPTKRIGSQRDDVAFESDFAPATTDVRSARLVSRARGGSAPPRPQRAGEPRGATVARVAKLRTRLARIGYVHRPLAGSARGRLDLSRLIFVDFDGSRERPRRSSSGPRRLAKRRTRRWGSTTRPRADRPPVEARSRASRDVAVGANAQSS